MAREREYAKVSPTFWSGTTGRAMKASGGHVQLLALYLITAPDRNILGLYRLPRVVIETDLPTSPTEISGALRELDRIGFAHYDDETLMVWIPTMMAWQVRESLKPTDNRVKAINRKWLSLPQNRFLAPFWARYATSHHLEARLDLGERSARSEAEPSLFARTPSEGPSQGASQAPSQGARAPQCGSPRDSAEPESESQAGPETESVSGGSATPTDSLSPNFRKFIETTDKTGDLTACHSLWIAQGYEIYDVAELIASRRAYVRNQERLKQGVCSVEKWIREGRCEQRNESKDQREDRERDEGARVALAAKWPKRTRVRIVSCERDPELVGRTGRINGVYRGEPPVVTVWLDGDGSGKGVPCHTRMLEKIDEENAA